MWPRCCKCKMRCDFKIFVTAVKRKAVVMTAVVQHIRMMICCCCRYAPLSWRKGSGSKQFRTYGTCSCARCMFMCKNVWYLDLCKMHACARTMPHARAPHSLVMHEPCSCYCRKTFANTFIAFADVFKGASCSFLQQRPPDLQVYVGFSGCRPDVGLHEAL